jgi:predicted  nucleic acid-binding Zn-ribbon protein
MRKGKIALGAIILILFASVILEYLQLKELTAKNRELAINFTAQKAEIADLREDRTNLWDNLVVLSQQIGDLQTSVDALNKTAGNASAIYPPAP